MGTVAAKKFSLNCIIYLYSKKPRYIMTSLDKVMNISGMLCCCGNGRIYAAFTGVLRPGWQAWNIHLPVLLNFVRKHPMYQFLTLTISTQLSCIYYLETRYSSLPATMQIHTHFLFLHPNCPSTFPYKITDTLSLMFPFEKSCSFVILSPPAP